MNEIKKAISAFPVTSVLYAALEMTPHYIVGKMAAETAYEVALMIFSKGIVSSASVLLIPEAGLLIVANFCLYKIVEVVVRQYFLMVHIAQEKAQAESLFGRLKVWG
jgi:hypothetical protein